MAQSDINLLPEQQLEALHHDENYKQQLYFLVAIIATLVTLTVIGGFVYFLFSGTVKAQEELIANQNERLKTLNSLWNSIIVLNQNVDLYPGIHKNTQQIRETFTIVTSGLNGITLLNFGQTEDATYTAEFRASTKEESKIYVRYLETALPDASIQQIQSIREYDDNVYFDLTIEY